MQLPDEYQFIEELSRSSETVIWRVEHKPSSRLLIAKGLVNEARSLHSYELINEYQTCATLDHPNILKFESMLQLSSGPVLLSQDHHYCSLDKWASGALALDEFWSVADQLLAAIEYCHQQHIIHKDINPSNIFIKPGSLSVCLADFGIAAKLSAVPNAITQPPPLEGCLDYIAPEQTGRLLWHPDQRSDLYSLGCTFYQLLSGRLPFSAANDFELIHAHITCAPVSLNELELPVPTALASVIDTLLEKDPKLRYQHATSLRRDLRKIKNGEAEGEFSPDIARRETQLGFSGKIVAREREVEILEGVSRRVLLGEYEKVLIQGAKGLGKTTHLTNIQIFHASIGGVVLSVDFSDASSERSVLKSLALSINKLLAFFSGQGEDVRKSIGERIRNMVGANLGLLLNDIPNLKHLCGVDNEEVDVEEFSRQDRVSVSYSKLIKSLADGDRPLLVTFDNLQYADGLAIKIIEGLCKDKSSSYLGIVISCNEDGVYEQDTVATFVADARSQFDTKVIDLNPLNLKGVRALLLDYFGSQNTSIDDLAKVVFNVCGGVPIESKLFLTEMLANGSIEVVEVGAEDNIDVQVTYDLPKLYSFQSSNKTGTAAVIKYLGKNTAQKPIVELMSCFESSVDDNTLITVLSDLDGNALSELEILSTLSQLCRDGVLFSWEEADYRFYQFTSDRYRSLVLVEIEGGRASTLHAAIYRFMCAKGEKYSSAAKLFHLEKMRLDYEDEDYRELLTLSLESSKSARDEGSFETALSFSQRCIKCVESHEDSVSPQQRFICFYAHYSNLYLTRHFEEADDYFKRLEHLPCSETDWLDLYAKRIDQLSVQVRSDEIIDVGSQYLMKLGVTLPASPEAVNAQVMGLRQEVQNITVSMLDSLPETSDPNLDGLLTALSAIALVAYHTASIRHLSEWIGLKRLALIVERGMCSSAPAAIIGYTAGAILPKKDYEKAYQYGQFASECYKRYPVSMYTSRAQLIFGNVVQHWKAPIAESFDLMRRGIKGCYEVGDLSYGALGLSYLINRQVLLGVPLDKVQEDIKTYSYIYIPKSDNYQYHSFNLAYTGFLQLQGKTESDESLNTEFYSTELIDVGGDSLSSQAAIYFSLRLRNGYFLGCHDSVGCLLAFPPRIEAALTGSIYFVEAYFYSALIAVDERFTVEGGDAARTEYLDASISKFDEWAALCPENFQHHYQLLLAERSRRKQLIKETIDYYRSAIKSASENHYLVVEAIACLRYAEFWSEIGELKTAQLYANRSLLLLEQWGVPRVIEKIIEQNDWLSYQISTNQPTHNSESAIDLEAIVSSIQAITKETEFSSLCRVVIKLSAESVSAERGVLFVRRGDTQVAIAECVTHRDVKIIDRQIVLDEFDNVPQSIISFVAKSGEVVSIANASVPHEYTADQYFRRYSPKSMLCLPIKLGDYVIGVAYFENNTSELHYADQRITVLKCLLSQSAIALQNASMFQQLNEFNDSLEAKVKDRTKQLEEARDLAEKATESKSNFLATMSHEIRTPMNGVLGMADLLCDTHLDQNQLSYVATIQESGKALLTIINDILDFSKIEAGKLELGEEEFSLLDCLAGIGDILGPLAHAKSLELVINVAPNVSDRQTGDANRLRQILINFVNNAIKFTETGFIEVSVLQEQGDVVFRVKDTGVGIAEENISRLFSAFSQIDEFATRQVGGTGLGLAISKRLVEAMGGEVGVQSEQGVGSIFWARIPSSQLAPEPNHSGDPKSIVVDPFDLSAKALESLLLRLGDSPEILEDLHSLSNVSLPKNKTLFVAHSVVQNYQQLVTQLVEGNTVIVTGADVSQKEALLSAPNLPPIKLDYLTKPFSFRDVKRFINAHAQRLDVVSEPKKSEMSREDIKILLAEDNVVNQKVVIGLLSMLGYGCDVVTNGEEAVEAFKKAHYDLVLMDCQMPKMDGYQATRAIRQLEEQSSGGELERIVPIVALTANAMRGDEQACLRAGMNRYLPKPIEKSRLEATIEELLHESGSRRARLLANPDEGQQPNA